MRIKIPFSSICRAELIDIHGKSVRSWYDEQKVKPDYVINGTLFARGFKPCGTVYISGEMVQNQGNGYGIGKDIGGTIHGGKPWDGTKWQWYLTGFPPLIYNGQKCDTSAFSQDVRRYTNHSAIGCDSTNLYLVYDRCSINSFQGRNDDIPCLMNLDGGGSSVVLDHGNPINKPTENRAIANCIAVWLKKPQGLRGKALSNLPVYDQNGNREWGRYIGKGDEIIISDKLTDNLLIEVRYPLLKGGYRTAYIKSTEKIKP